MQKAQQKYRVHKDQGGGKEGFEKIKSSKADLILLDIIMPNMNGYEILEAKQKDPSIANIPVIIISNSGQPVEIHRALALGVKDYLVKAQFDPEEVLTKIKSLFIKNENLSSLDSLDDAMKEKKVNCTGRLCLRAVIRNASSARSMAVPIPRP